MTLHKVLLLAALFAFPLQSNGAGMSTDKLLRGCKAFADHKDLAKSSPDWGLLADMYFCAGLLSGVLSMADLENNIHDKPSLVCIKHPKNVQPVEAARELVNYIEKNNVPHIETHAVGQAVHILTQLYPCPK